MKITKEYLKTLIKEELQKEGFPRRSYNPNGGPIRKPFGSSEDYTGTRPGEVFIVPGEAKIKFKVVDESGNVQSLSRRMKYKNEKDLDQKTEIAKRDIIKRYAPAKVNFGDVVIMEVPSETEI